MPLPNLQVTIQRNETPVKYVTEATTLQMNETVVRASSTKVAGTYAITLPPADVARGHVFSIRGTSIGTSADITITGPGEATYTGTLARTTGANNSLLIMSDGLLYIPIGALTN